MHRVKIIIRPASVRETVMKWAQARTTGTVLNGAADAKTRARERGPLAQRRGTARRPRLGKTIAAFCAALLNSISWSGAHAEALTTLYRFQGGSDGSFPTGNLVKDKAGNLYGATGAGGVINANCPGGCGTIFKLAPNGVLTTLYAFTGGADGGFPGKNLSRDIHGNLYGTARSGGYTGPNCAFGAMGCGTAWKLAPDGTLTVLHAFAQDDATDGISPSEGVRKGLRGHYGTTQGGGSVCASSDFGCGAIFRLSTKGAESILHAFQGLDGIGPVGIPVVDPAGNLYGATFEGGSTLNTACEGEGCGTIYRLAPDGTETILYNFTGDANGANPSAGPVRDKAGNLYGTASQGGTKPDQTGLHCPHIPAGCGTAYRLAPDGTFSVLHSFNGTDDGASPGGALYRDRRGNLYGTTEGGGDFSVGLSGGGIVFEIDPRDVFVVLHTFHDNLDGAWPNGALTPNGKGGFYGTTQIGGGGPCLSGLGCGTIFKVQQFP